MFVFRLRLTFIVQIYSLENIGLLIMNHIPFGVIRNENKVGDNDSGYFLIFV